MRNFKKLLCIVLTLSIVMSSFAAFSREYLTPYKFMEDIFRFDVGDFAAGSEESTDAFDADVNRMKLLQTLGIWDDAEKPKSALITMTEFSIIMSNLRLGAENALKGVYAQEENLNEAKATYKNAFEHLLESLGYYYRCAQYGNTDESLLIVAADIGLISENPENINAFITRAELAKLISKALTIDLCTMEYTSTGGYKYTVADGRNLLNTIHGIYEIGGFVNAVPGLAVYGGSSLRDGYIQIDRRNVNTSGLDLRGFFGSRVIAYATFDEDINEFSIIYMDYADDYTVTEIDFNDIVDMDAYSITYVNDENVEVEIDVDNLTYITENGSKLSKIPEDYDYYRTNEGKIIFTASEKKGDIDTAIIYKYKYFVASYVDTNNFKVGVQFHQEHNGKEYVPIDDKAVNEIYVDGAKTDYSMIPAGAAFRYFTCADTGYTEIIAVTKKTEGEITGIYDDLVTISDVEYRQSKDLLNIIAEGKKPETNIPSQERVKDLELGLSTTYYVFDNLIVGYMPTNTYKWGYLKGITKSRTSIDPDLTLKILTENSDWIELKIKDKFELDGQTGVTKEEFLARIDTNMGKNIYVIDNIVRYKVGKAGELAALDTVDITQYETHSDEDVEWVYNYNYYINWTYEWLQQSCPYFMSPSTVIFVVPAGEEDETKYRAVNVQALPSGGQPGWQVPMDFYTPNQFHQIGAAVCTKDLGDIGDGGNSAGNAIFVESIRYALLDAENQEFGYRIVGKQTVGSATDPNGGYLKEVTFSIPEDLLDKNDGEEEYNEKLKLEVGDLISATITGGLASSWSMILKQGKVPEIAAKTPDPEDKDYNTSGTTTVTGQGIIKAVNTVSHHMVVEFDGVDYPILSRCKVTIDVANNKITHTSIADFKPGETIYLYMNYGRASYVIKNTQ